MTEPAELKTIGKMNWNAFALSGERMKEGTSSIASAAASSQMTYVDKSDSHSSGAPRKNICCACPNLKRLRDECVVSHGEDACEKWIDAHKRCLRSEGFKV